MSPMICQKFFAGLAKLKSSTMTPFQRSLPTKARMTRLTKKESIIAKPSAYTSCFCAGVESLKPSTATRAALAIGDVFIFL